MTCIAVVSDGVRCCMAADSQASHNGTKAVLDRPKIVKVSGVLFGAEGSFATTDFLRSRFSLGWIDEQTRIDAIAARFVEELRSYLRANGLMRKVNDNEELPGQTLIAYQDQWRLIDGGGSVIPLAGQYWAIGSGGAEARGAMNALDRASDSHGISPTGMTADYVAHFAVRAACELDDGCSEPVTEEWTDA